MAINRVLMLGVAAVACLGGAWVALSQPPQPEGCPEDGCRVGHRFEDGGIAPEGWEPYVTDDPVVALMDACLTYFMTGEVAQSSLLSVQKRWRDIVLQTEAPDRYLRVGNYPSDSFFGTFHCYERYHYEEGSFAEIFNWVDARFVNAPDWMTDLTLGGEAVASEALSFDQFWYLESRNSELEVRVRVWHDAETSELDGAELAIIRFELFADFHGPPSQLHLVSYVPDIEF